MTELSPQTPARPDPRGGPASRGRRPGPALVIWGTIALFAVTFAFLTYQLSIGRDPLLGRATASRPVLVRQVIKRRVITTIIPTPGRSSVSASGSVAGSFSSSGFAPVTTGAS
ncbi:MAG TPA: hypothetical protein VF770_02145 [Solirubrobacterales bacterium]